MRRLISSAPPTTWSEFLDLARFFTRPDDDLSGCVVAGKPDGHNSVYDFCLHLWSRGGELLSDTGRPIFASRAGQAALHYYLDLIHEHRVTQPEPWKYDSVAAGMYLSDDIFIEIVTDARGFTATQIEISLSRSLSLLSQFSSTTATNLNLRYSRDY